MGYKIGDIVYYKYRYVFADGHITRASFPHMVLAEGSNDRFDVTIQLVEDLDSQQGAVSYPIVELYRKVNSGAFLLLERVKPSERTMTRKISSTQYTTPSGTTFTPASGVPSESFYDPDTDTITFVDRGQNGSITELNNINNVFTEDVVAQTTSRDRVILGGITYPNVDVEVVGTSGERVQMYTPSLQIQNLSLISEDATIYPPNMTVQLYGKAKFYDGTESVHFELGNSITTTGISSNVVHTYNTNSSFNKSNIAEIGLYLNYESNPDTESEAVTFETNEVANARVQTIASLYGNEPDNFPTAPIIFYGYKYVMIELWDLSGSNDKIWVIRVNDPERNNTEKSDGTIEPENERCSFFVLDESKIDGLPLASTIDAISAASMPDTLDITLIGGQARVYNLVGYDMFPEIPTEVNRQTNFFENYPNGTIDELHYRFLYKLADVDAVITAASNQSLQLRVKDMASARSTRIDSSRYTSDWVDVVGVLDSSGGGDPKTKEEFGLPYQNNVYLLTAPDSIYADLDLGVQTTDFSPQAYSEDLWVGSKPNLASRLTFEMRGITFVSQTPTTYTVAEDVRIRPNFTYGVTVENRDELEGLIYVGKLDVGRSMQAEVFNGGLLRHTGYTFTKENNLIRAVLNPYNLYEKRVLANNLRASQDNFPNQLIFSEPATNDLYSGSRIFDYKNFIDIEPRYGSIIGLESTGSVLVIFTQRAIGFARVGEVLTQSASGETYVNTDQFLSSPQWLLTNVKGYYPESILQSELGLFFSDGRDVFLYNSGLQNLTNGAIDLSSATRIVIAYDTKLRELIVSTQTESYGYSLDLKQWYGPYTYVNQQTFVYDGLYYGILNGSIVRHNTGNTFGGATYQTIIDSGNNDLGDASMLKTYRRLLFEYDHSEQTDDINVVYSHSYNFDEINLGNHRVVSDMADFGDGLKRLGLRSFVDSVDDNTTKTNPNARNLFWRVISSMADFSLRMVGVEYFSRGRR